ncbi:MAG: alkyl sulfatase C-terminal domain-containing protein [Acidimicrobiales bacterium]
MRAPSTPADLRWALELGSWLVRRTDPDGNPLGEPGDRGLLAEVVRTVGQRTTAANIRNWCLTRARELEGSLDLERLRVHVLGRGAVLGAAPATTVHALRVMLDPGAALGVDDELRWRFADGTVAGLRIRHHVAVPTDGADADLEIGLDIETWADICSGRTTVADAVASGSVTVTGDHARLDRFVACFDHPAFSG